MESQSNNATIRSRVVIILCALVFLASVWHFASTSAGITGQAPVGAFVLALFTGASDLLLAIAVMISAGGWGYLAFGWLLPRSSPAPAPGEPPDGKGAAPAVATGLVLVTAIALGYWLLSTFLMIVGSLTTGLLHGYIWWPVVGAGIALAAWQGRKGISTLATPRFFDGRFLTWVLLFIAAGAWVAGATMPPGFGLFGDGYDVLLYHLQLPREYLNAQHISTLNHNVYSHYPLGNEMLFLLAMILRGGAYEGMYAAQLTHGLMAVLAAVAIFTALRRDDDRRARFSMILLATTPFVLYLSWLAFSELTEVLYLTLAVLWMRQWIASWGSAIPALSEGSACPALSSGIASPDTNAHGTLSVGVRSACVRCAAIVGLCLGGACCSKYLSVGLIALPVLAVMLALCMVRGRGSADSGAASRDRRIGHVVLAGVLTLAVFSPWLIRNQLAVGNPVFPLASDLLGRGYWSPQEQQRWLDGHGPEKRPPVPPPPGYQPSQTPDRLVGLWIAFMDPQKSLMGQVMVILFLISVATVLAKAPGVGPWDASLLGIFVVQVLVWMFATHEIPARFIVPAIVPMVLLGGGFLSMLSRVKRNPLRPSAAPPASGGAWGLAPAVMLLAIAVLVNLVTMNAAYVLAQNESMVGVIGQRGEDLTMPAGINRLVSDQTKARMPADAKFLLVSTVPMFFPDGSIYATAFDPQPLLTLSHDARTPEALLESLRHRDVDYVMVNWADLLRLGQSYGVPEELSREMYARRAAGLPPGLSQLEQLKPLGLVELVSPVPALRKDSKSPLRFKANGREITWPGYTIYALPWASFKQWPTSQPASRPATHKRERD